MNAPLPRIVRTDVLCAIGGGTEQAWASARAGMGRIVSSHVMDRHFNAIQMGLVPESALPPLPEPLAQLPLPSRARRMLRLAGPVFKTVAEGLPAPVATVIGLPDIPPASAPWLRDFPVHLQQMTGVAIDMEHSGVLPVGRAAALMALERALQTLQAGAVETIVVGGVDTYFDLRLLAELDAEGRVLGPRVMDGFVPGEGAAFYVLTTSELIPDTGVRIVVEGAASSMDPGHRYGEAPAKGEGLAQALEALRQRMAPLTSPVATTFAGFNGEHFESKLWGVARLRHDDLFSKTMTMEHPADKYGDAGAATGALLVALAAEGLKDGSSQGPALVWAASDREPRACAMLARE